MKILVIPDIHGNTEWKKNFTDNIDKVDKCVFLGDYYDSFNENEKGENAALNFQDIMNTTMPYEDKVDILIGNHDLENYIRFGNCSGFQENMYYRYNSLLETFLPIMKVAVEYDGYVFSHAGFTNTWFKGIKNWLSTISITDFKNPIEASNWILQSDNVQGLGYIYGYDTGDGDSIKQGPLWVRPASLIKDSYYNKQVVGHTEMKIPNAIIEANGNTFFFCDTQNHNTFFILDTEKEYKTTNMEN